MTAQSPGAIGGGGDRAAARPISGLAIFASISALFVAATIIMPHASHSSPLWRLDAFNLARELNYGAWWSSIGLFAAAMLAFESAGRSDRRSRAAWAVIAALCLGLAADELGEFHESIGNRGGWTWTGLLPFALIVVLATTFVIARLLRQRASRRSGVLIGVAFVCFALVALQERIEHALSWPEWSKGLRAGLEEGTELAGLLILLAALSAPRVARAGPGLRSLVADPRGMPAMPVALLAGLVVHLVHRPFTDPIRGEAWTGEPALLFPVFAYVVLFAACFWSFIHGPSRSRAAWAAAALLFLAHSAGLVRSPWDLLPFAGRLLPGQGAGAGAGGLALLLGEGALVALLLAGTRPSWPGRRPLLLAALGVLAAIGAVAAGSDRVTVATGLGPFLMGVLLTGRGGSGGRREARPTPARGDVPLDQSGTTATSSPMTVNSTTKGKNT